MFEELATVSEELDASGVEMSDELLAIWSAELEDVFSVEVPESTTSEDEDSSKTSLRELEEVVPVSELESPVAIEELLSDISGFSCSETSTLEDESEEHAESAAATAVPKKYLKALDAIGRI
jgi:hypothetical protein